MRVLRLVALPFGYLAFVVALAALAVASKLLGEQHELGFFSGRLSQAVWRYPEVTRRGVQVAWVAWGLLLIVAVTPIDPLTTRWDEVGLLGLGLAALWRHVFGGRQAGR